MTEKETIEAADEAALKLALGEQIAGPALPIEIGEDYARTLLRAIANLPDGELAFLGRRITAAANRERAARTGER